MVKTEIDTGVWFLEVSELDLRILCGSPPDVVKLLMKRGFIVDKHWDKGLWETGPNAILLSDLPMQGGKFANLIEFPVLQMFYRQGMIIPGHPGNTGVKPVVIGLSSQIQAVCDYLFHGTYGLSSREELLHSGAEKEFADEIIRLKMAFAFNSMRKSEEILDLYSLDSGSAVVKDLLTVKHTALNKFTFSYGTDEIEIDLNLYNTSYNSPIKLEYHRVRRDYFSVVHVGEGDGWDQNHPCMSSIVFFQGKPYLIDAGPNIIDSLTSLGICVNELAGIFHTHAHDDHFAGLTSLVRTDHRIKYYSSTIVRSSVMKKLTSLMSVPEKRFMRSFDVQDLKLNEWNNIGGLEVMPVFSPHPVETNVFFFRAMWEGGYRVYAHLADIASKAVLENMLLKADTSTPFSKSLFESFTSLIGKGVNLKKIDIGGGMIHGDALDFEGDTSRKIVLAHTSKELSTEEMEIGSTAGFGMEDSLIPTRREYIREQAGFYLRSYFPSANESDIEMLLNCAIVTLNVGHILQKKDTPAKVVHLIVSGVAEMIDAASSRVFMLSAGTLIGESAALGGNIPQCTYKAKSYINVLEIPQDLFRLFIMKGDDYEDAKRTSAIAFFLQTTFLFGESVSSPVLYKIANNLVPGSTKAGEVFECSDEPSLILIVSGSCNLFIDSTLVDRIWAKEFFGEECVFFSGGSLMTARAEEDCQWYSIKADILRGIPIVEWKMLEVYERRLTSYGSAQ